MTLPSPRIPSPQLLAAIEKDFAGTRGRVLAAVAANPRGTTFEAALAQVQRFSKLSGKSAQERKSIS
jgi:hypothetical protein